MAIILEAAYSKKLGLPGFSSHSYVVSVRTELTDLSQAPQESSRLYRMLQDAVDKEIQEVGFIPDPFKYGFFTDNDGNTGGNGHSPTMNGNGNHQNGHTNGPRNGTPMSSKQFDLINKIVRENNADKNEIEKLAMEMFGVGVKQLNSMQASNFIDELFQQYGRGKQNGVRNRMASSERTHS